MRRIVIADDERWVRELLRGIIDWRRLGVEIVGEAANGEDALRLCRHTEAQVLITDIRMPGMDGLDLVTAVMATMPSLQCIFISGHEEFLLAKKALQLGALDYLVKPLDGAEIERVVKRAFARIDADQVAQREKAEKELRLKKLEALVAGDQGQASDVPERDWRIKKALVYIEDNLSRTPSLLETADKCYVSPSYLSGLFRKEFGVGFNRYVTELRLRKACRLLSSPELMVRDIAGILGFSNPNYFSRFFKRETGLAPHEFRLSTLKVSRRLR